MTFEASNDKARTIEERLQVLLDKEDIRGLVARTCRSIDRLDQDLLASCFHPEATVDYSPLYKGSAQGLIDMVGFADQMFDKSQYNTGTQSIDVDGDVGRAETYVWVMKVLPELTADGDHYGRISQMRYLDKLERRDGAWRITHRIMIPDVGVFHVVPKNPPSIGMYKSPSEWTLPPTPAKRDRSDLSYVF